MIKNSVALVTGGAGFIGSHLVNKLLNDGAKHIYVVDSLEYGALNNLKGIDPQRLSFLQFKLGSSNPDQLKEKIQDLDYVFHFAAEKHNQSKESPRFVIDANIKGTLDILNLAKEKKAKKTIFASSLYTYGKMKGPAFSEEDILTPSTIYGISKHTGEELCHFFSTYHDTPCVVLRFFFVYGPYQYSGNGYQSVIVKNIQRMLQGQKPLIHGDGKQVLDYIFVDDAIEAIHCVLEEKSNFNIYNVGSGNAYSILDIIEELRKFFPDISGAEYAPPDFTHNSFRVSNSCKLFNAHGFRADTTITKGIEKTLNWFTRDYL